MYMKQNGHMVICFLDHLVGVGSRMDHQKMYEPKPLVSEKHRALANRHTGWISDVRNCLRHKIQGLGLNMGYTRDMRNLDVVGSIPTQLFSMLYSIQNQSQEVLSLILDLSTRVNDEKYINISAGWTDHIAGLD